MGRKWGEGGNNQAELWVGRQGPSVQAGETSDLPSGCFLPAAAAWLPGKKAVYKEVGGSGGDYFELLRPLGAENRFLLEN